MKELSFAQAELLVDARRESVGVGYFDGSLKPKNVLASLERKGVIKRVDTRLRDGDIPLSKNMVILDGRNDPEDPVYRRVHEIMSLVYFANQILKSWDSAIGNIEPGKNMLADALYSLVAKHSFPGIHRDANVDEWHDVRVFAIRALLTARGANKNAHRTDSFPAAMKNLEESVLSIWLRHESKMDMGTYSPEPGFSTTPFLSKLSLRELPIGGRWCSSRV